MNYQVWSDFSNAFLFAPSSLDIAIGHAEIMARECAHRLTYRVIGKDGTVAHITALLGHQLPIVRSSIGFQYMLDVRGKRVTTYYGATFELDSNEVNAYRAMPVVGYTVSLDAWQFGLVTPVKES